MFVITEEESTNFRKTCGELYRFYRKSSELSIQAVHKLVGVSASAISDFENGKTLLSLENIFLLFKPLKVSIKEYFYELADKFEESYSYALSLTIPPLSNSISGFELFYNLDFVHEELERNLQQDQPYSFETTVNILTFSDHLRYLDPNYKIPKIDYNPKKIYNRFSKIQKWDRKNLLFFSNIADLLNNPFESGYLTDNIIEDEQRWLVQPTTELGYVNLLLNTSYLLIKNRKFVEAGSYLERVKKIITPARCEINLELLKFHLDYEYLLWFSKLMQGDSKAVSEIWRIVAKYNSFKIENMYQFHCNKCRADFEFVQKNYRKKDSHERSFM